MSIYLVSGNIAGCGIRIETAKSVLKLSAIVRHAIVADVAPQRPCVNRRASAKGLCQRSTDNCMRESFGVGVNHFYCR